MPIAKTTSVQSTTAGGGANSTKRLQDIYLIGKYVTFLAKNLVAAQFGDEEMVPAHSGKACRWLFHNALALPSAAVAEGDDPTDSRATVVNFVEGTLATWTDFVEYTEEIEDYSHPGTMDQFSQLVSQQSAEVIDREVHKELNTTTTTRDMGTACTLNGLRLASLDLQKNDAKPHSKSSDGNSFVAFLSPEQFEDMRGEGNPAYFQIKTQERPESGQGVYRGKVQPRDAGYGVEIYVTTNVQQDASTPVNDLGSLVANNSFGVSSFQTNILRPKISVVPPTPSLASPAGRRGLISWKAKFIPKLFDSKRVNKLISDVA